MEKRNRYLTGNSFRMSVDVAIVSIQLITFACMICYIAGKASKK
jgi:hypothetical protein